MILQFYQRLAAVATTLPYKDIIQLYSNIKVKSGRSSGSITLFYKKNFQTKVKVPKQSKHYIWLKYVYEICPTNLSSCIRNLSNKLKDLYICITYIPPVKSPYYLEDIFPSIKNESCVLLIGDMNARTTNLSEYLDTSGNKSIDTCQTTSHCSQPLITTKRVNIDHQSNTHGHKVIDLCKTCNLRILNGRKLGDSFGKPTFFSNEGCPSTIDCAIISGMYFHQVSSFTVKPQSSLNDHCQIITRIKVPLDVRTTNISKQTKNNPTKPLPNFHWSSESNVNFKAALNTPVCLNKLTDFMNRIFKLLSNSIEEANKQRTEILITAAKMSLNLKSKLKSKHPKTKKWFNVECKKLRKNFHALSNQKNKAHQIVN